MCRRNLSVSNSGMSAIGLAAGGATPAISSGCVASQSPRPRTRRAYFNSSGINRLKAGSRPAPAKVWPLQSARHPAYNSVAEEIEHKSEEKIKQNYDGPVCCIRGIATRDLAKYFRAMVHSMSTVVYALDQFPAYGFPAQIFGRLMIAGRQPSTRIDRIQHPQIQKYRKDHIGIL